MELILIFTIILFLAIWPKSYKERTNLQEYIIVNSINNRKFAGVINKYIEQGYQPFGSLTVNPEGYYVQIMVK